MATAPPVVFEVVTTPIDKNCRDLETEEGSDAPSLCDGYENYTVYRYYNFYGGAILGIQSDDFQVQLLPAQCGDNQTYGAELHWLLADGTPFAVVTTVTCYASAGESGFDEILETYYIIRGIGPSRQMALDIPGADAVILETVFKKANELFLNTPGE